MSAIQFREAISPKHQRFLGTLTAIANKQMTTEERYGAVVALCDETGLEPRTPDRERVAAWAKVVRGSLAPCPVVDSAAVREQMLTARTSVEEILNRLEREMLEAYDEN